MTASDEPIFPNNRLREAREYLGLTQAEVAGFLDLLVFELQRYESGARWLDPEREGKAALLLRRPISYLRGEPIAPIEISPEMDKLLEATSLSPNDKAAVLDFVQFLKHSAETEPRDEATPLRD